MDSHGKKKNARAVTNSTKRKQKNVFLCFGGRTYLSVGRLERGGREEAISRKKGRKLAF